MSAIGDTCHTLPVIRTLQAEWPPCQITWVIGKVEESLMRGIEGVEFIIFDKSLGWRAYADLRRNMRGRRFELLLHMHASMRANLASLCIPAPVKLGFDRARARDYQWLFTTHRIPARPHQHVMDGLFEFAQALGVERREARWEIPLSDADRRFAAEQAGARRPILVVSPCSSQRFRNYRNWPAERYAAVADHAAEHHGAQVLLTGGGSALEAAYGERITSLTRCQPRNLIGKTTLKQLLALLERATVLLCPDSGPAHMATAVGTPVIGLYATSNRFRTGPYYSQQWVVDRYPQAVAAELGRRVEEIPWGARVRNPDAMASIEVSAVIARLDGLLGVRRPGTARTRGGAADDG